jgi:hypothetical protein
LFVPGELSALSGSGAVIPRNNNDDVCNGSLSVYPLWTNTFVISVSVTLWKSFSPVSVASYLERKLPIRL